MNTDTYAFASLARPRSRILLVVLVVLGLVYAASVLVPDFPQAKGVRIFAWMWCVLSLPFLAFAEAKCFSPFQVLAVALGPSLVVLALGFLFMAPIPVATEADDRVWRLFWLLLRALGVLGCVATAVQIWLRRRFGRS